VAYRYFAENNVRNPRRFFKRVTSKEEF